MRRLLACQPGRRLRGEEAAHADACCVGAVRWAQFLLLYPSLCHAAPGAVAAALRPPSVSPL